MHKTKYLLILLAALVIGCGNDPVDLDSDGGDTPGADGSAGSSDGGGSGPDGSTPGADGGATNPDGGNSSVCGTTQCSNCIDDDNDGLTDGFDPECIAAADDREDSFATGLPGDNMDPKQDCFFDGDSGGGNDKCTLDACCLLGTCDEGVDCTPDPRCIEFCSAVTPPGCDCFGCCTICDDAGCRDIVIDLNLAPECDSDTLHDTDKCPSCEKIDACETECDTSNCILCPGQTPEDLPPDCNMQNQCPDGQTSCGSTADCPADHSCTSGCCVYSIIIG